MSGIPRHGHSNPKTPTYYSWANMIARCTSPSHERWADYGGRGITVCSRWLVFDNFLSDMGKRPLGRTLDRIKNEGNYEPDNCRWATRLEQGRNSRSNVVLSFNGETKILEEWARFLGMKQQTLWRRLFVSKWTVERALSIPVKNSRRPL